LRASNIESASNQTVIVKSEATTDTDFLIMVGGGMIGSSCLTVVMVIGYKKCCRKKRASLYNSKINTVGKNFEN